MLKRPDVDRLSTRSRPMLVRFGPESSKLGKIPAEVLSGMDRLQTVAYEK